MKHRLGLSLAAGIMVAGLLAPALWNGFPLIFADTGGYLSRPFEHTLLPGRSALYGAFLAAGIPLDFWPTVLIQAVLTLWIVLLVLRTHGLGGRPVRATLIVLALAIFTSLPWYASQLMPDIFVPVAVLALYLVAFRRAELCVYEKALLVGAVSVAIAFHMAILALMLALFAALALLRATGFRPRPGLALPMLAIAGGMLLAPVSNLAIAGRLAFTPGGTHFVFARLIQDGIVARYLAERCPDAALAICSHAADLPPNADGWLWGSDGPFYKLGGWEGYEAEARAIIADTLRRYPGQHLVTAAAAAAEQFVRFDTGEGVNPHDTAHAVENLERFAPEALPRFRAAAQQRDAFDFTLINAVHIPVAVAALFVLAFALLPRAPVSPAARALAFTVLVALAANAAISGVLSNPNERYQSRLIPIATLAAAIVLSDRRNPPPGG